MGLPTHEYHDDQRPLQPDLSGKRVVTAIPPLANGYDQKLSFDKSFCLPDAIDAVV